MEHVNGWCFRGIYKGGLWENDLHVSAQILMRVVSVWHGLSPPRTQHLSEFSLEVERKKMGEV